ncbi:MAG: protein kinase, partial [Verrucomicrobiae bacterium]|nr:protein kinase [Verrucomicrobiae bacterium]
MSDRDKPHPLERSIYLQAAELESPAERVDFLDQACEGDDHLRERVELLLNFSEAESFGVAFQHRDPLLDDEATLPVTGGRTVPEPSPVAEDNYRIGPELARGGMGSIRQAEDRKLKRSVALKIMHSHVGSDPSSQARFVREAEVLALLSHPNIVPVYDIVWENGKPLFYTMKLVKGRTLQQIINDLREKNPATLTEYPLDHLLGIFLKVCDAIAFAHSR